LKLKYGEVVNVEKDLKQYNLIQCKIWTQN